MLRRRVEEKWCNAVRGKELLFFSFYSTIYRKYGLHQLYLSIIYPAELIYRKWWRPSNVKELFFLRKISQLIFLLKKTTTSLQLQSYFNLSKSKTYITEIVKLFSFFLCFYALFLWHFPENLNSLGEIYIICSLKLTNS